MKKLITIFSLLVLSISTVSVYAQTYEKFANNVEKSYLEYSMFHPMHEWNAFSHQTHAVLLANATKTDLIQVAVAARISTFNSENANRDSHTMEVLDAIKYPAVYFLSKSIVPQGDSIIVTGDLFFFGKVEEKTFKAKKYLDGNDIIVDGAFDITITEFGIKRPTLMGIPTKDLIKVKFHIVF